MLTDIQLILEFSHVSKNMCITIHDRNQLVAEISEINNSVVGLNFKFSVPNQLLFNINQLGSKSSSVSLKKITLGGLDLTPKILDQICIYTPVNLDKSIELKSILIFGEISNREITTQSYSNLFS